MEKRAQTPGAASTSLLFVHFERHPRFCLPLLRKRQEEAEKWRRIRRKQKEGYDAAQQAASPKGLSFGLSKLQSRCKRI